MIETNKKYIKQIQELKAEIKSIKQTFKRYCELTEEEIKVLKRKLTNYGKSKS